MNYVEELVEFLDKNGLDASEKTIDRFSVYADFLLSENEKYNLTAIKEKDKVYSSHFIDSLFGAALIDKNAFVVDLGAGAGFPSVPIKIVRDDLNLTLLDSVNKKVNFLNSLCEKLNLSNCRAIHERIEDFARTEKRESFDFALARAVAPLPTLLEYAVPLLTVGGKFIAYKTNSQEEIKQSEKALRLLNCSVAKIIDYGDFEIQRSLIVIKKNGKTSDIYPRGKNAERKNPLV